MQEAEPTVKKLETDDLPPVLTVPEVARLLRIGRAAAYELANRKDFPTIRIGRTIRIPREALLRWMEKTCEENSAAGVEKIIPLKLKKSVR
ncbi:hypothetical protein E308F_16130 [Moorella sp. E308F]|uniref:helix-turn-helix domain-containing protein n=1 Tax=unclassified Neomoorella TaxID=2676739 RepID=UPI0010FFAF05|nr:MULTISPECIES: helix-turn-helix domain-containing protein [unclassified Moorella (in: firmicutes)]GEA15369.1 hypothetical protein E308F_16130 [Moorella sp. E308F]GEA19770.1 hypothetical protein E306M_29090 [Moorella sp. E306M]